MKATVRYYLLATLSISAVAFGESSLMDCSNLQGSGVLTLTDYSGAPNEWGVLENYTLDLPEHSHGVYYKSPWWPAGGNRVRATAFNRLADLRSPEKQGAFAPQAEETPSAEGGIFALFKISERDYLALLPIAGNSLFSWFDISPEGNLKIKLGHLGKDPIENEDVPLYAWARASNPYQAAAQAWQSAADCPSIKGNFRLREEKEYPEPFEYLGWCSWEFFRHSEEAKEYNGFSEKTIVSMMEGFRKLGKPVRWMLLDNGHFNGATDFSPREKGWPNGYKPLSDACREDGVKWVGIWYAFMGGGKHPFKALDSLPKGLQERMTVVAGAVLPKPTIEDASAFFEYLYSYAKAGGLDFVKIDFSTRPIVHYAGEAEVKLGSTRIRAKDNLGLGNPYKAHVAMFRALEKVTGEQMNGMINCNWHHSANLFNLNKSVVGRCSEDYKPGNAKRGIEHQFHSYSAMPWLGQIAWGDHDMFHSSDKEYGRLMAASKALSGAPVYISDGPKECDMSAIAPLCYLDGKVLRPLAPGAPIYDDVFYNPGEGRAFRLMAPLANRAVAFAANNLEPDSETTVKALFTPDMYNQAPGLLQPYPGEWETPDEGLAYYNVYSGKGGKFDDAIELQLTGFSDCLIQVGPIQGGWSVIGRTDKYLCAAAVKSVDFSPEKLTVALRESGPFAIYSADGAPRCKDLEFTHAGNGIYKAEPPVEKNPVVFTVER